MPGLAPARSLPDAFPASTPSSAPALARRGFFASYHMHTILGVGICDAGKSGYSKSPIYKSWVRMIERCYSPAYQALRPTYRDVQVDERWLTYSCFRDWAESRYREGTALDKDIICPGNRIYGPEKCCFVPRSINNLLTTSSAKRGAYPLGVDLHKTERKFRARVWRNGAQSFAGHFTNPEDAHRAWQQAKIAAIQAAIDAHPDLDQMALAGLRARIDAITNDIRLGRQTLRV